MIDQLSQFAGDLAMTASLAVQTLLGTTLNDPAVIMTGLLTLMLVGMVVIFLVVGTPFVLFAAGILLKRKVAPARINAIR